MAAAPALSVTVEAPVIRVPNNRREQVVVRREAAAVAGDGLNA